MTETAPRPVITAMLIVRDCADTLPHCLDSLEARPDITNIVVVDTGSVDGTRDLLGARQLANRQENRACIRMVSIAWQDDFSLARNEALATARAIYPGPDDPVDPRVLPPHWLLWIDADDVLEGDLKKVVDELVAHPEVGGVWVYYDYAYDERGNAVMTFTRERLVRADLGWEWRQPVHEVLAPADPAKVVWAQTDDIRIGHRHRKPHEGDANGESRNMRMLKRWLEREPEHPRIPWYLGLQSHGEGRLTESTTWLERALKTPGLPVHDQWVALVYLGWNHLGGGDTARARAAALRAIEGQERWAEPYVILAQSYADEGKWEKSLRWATIGLEGAGPPPPYIFSNPLHHPWLLKCFQERALGSLGEVERALQIAEQAAEQRPSPGLIEDITQYRVHLAREKALAAALTLYETLAVGDETLKAADLHRVLPSPLLRLPAIVAAKARAKAQVSHLNSDRAYQAHYRNHPGWVPVPDDQIEGCAEIPRQAWIRERLLRAGARRVLDVGSADGVLALALARRGLDVTCVDIDPRVLAKVRERAEAAGLSERIRTVEGMLEQLGPAELGAEPYDAVVAGEVIEHVQQPQHFLACLESFGRRVLLTTPNGPFDSGLPPADDWRTEGPRNHVRVFSRDDLATLILAMPNRQVWELHADVRDAPFHGILLAEYSVLDGARQGPNVTIFCGGRGGQWGPYSPNETGLGGSETAVVEVARHLVAMGCAVKVFATASGVYDGVVYLPWEEYQPRDCDLFVAWRDCDVLDVLKERGVTPGQVWVWPHDVLPVGLTEERAARVDRVIALSRWHESNMLRELPFLHGKLLRAGNGIDPARFEHRPERVPGSFIWASSLDRGLSIVLRGWGELKAAIPDATLDIYYGSRQLEIEAARSPIAARMLQDYRWGLAVARPIGGVTVRGQINQRDLAEAYGRASVLLYPGPHDFTETYCISVLEAQAAGCVPVTRDNGALRETNHGGLVLHNKGPWSRWVRAAAEANRWTETEREPLRQWALRQTWQSVARTWLAALVATAPAPEPVAATA